MIARTMPKKRPVEAVEDPRERYYAERVRAHSRDNPDIHWPSAEVVFNLIYTYDVVLAEVTHALARFDLTPAGFNVLKILRRAGTEGCPLGELSKLLVVSKANVTGLIDVLEKRGLIERASERSDRRIRLARIT
jgi:MarR family 2-MHQ and catechol resistance regulon transcriptional repressor